MSIRGVNDGIREVRGRVEFSKRRAEDGATSMRSADEKIQAAHKLLGLAGQLLVEAATLHTAGASSLKLGSDEIVNVPAVADRIFAGSNAAAALIDNLRNYTEAYHLLATRAQYSNLGLQDTLPEVREMRGDLSNRGGVVEGIVRDSVAQAATALRLDADLRERFV